MTDYVSREGLLKGRNELLCHDVNCGECPFSGYGAHPVCELSERISSIPAADVAPVVHAEWIMTEFVSEDTGIWWSWHCSNCGEKYLGLGKLDLRKHKYCPNCGADMREGN